MHVTILIPIAILCSIWILAIIIYRVLNIKGKKKWVKISSVTAGSILAGIFSLWILVSMGGSIFFHVGFNADSREKERKDQININTSKYPGQTEPLTSISFWDDKNYFKTEVDEFKDEKLTIMDSGGNDLQYYLYSKNNENIKEGNIVVILHHGLSGSRFRNYPFIEQLQKINHLDKAVFVSYDSVGWNDGKKRGKPTLGKVEGEDLYRVIMDVNDKLKPSEIILYGYSMGGGTIYNTLNDFSDNLFSKEKPEENIINKVIIDSGYYDLSKELKFFAEHIEGIGFLTPMFIDMGPWLYSQDLGGDIRFNALDVVSQLDIPLMLVHARKDAVVDFAFSCEMNAIRNKRNLGDKTFSWFEDEEGHVEFVSRHRSSFRENVNKFLTTESVEDINTQGCQ